MIIVRNLTKQLNTGRVILDRISFQADVGELIVMLGGSGSGKTTLLRCIALREKWDDGQLILDGKEMTKPSLWEQLKLRRDWAFLEEKPVFNLNKTALKTVLSGRLLRTPIWRLLTGRVAMDDHMLGMDYLEKVGLMNHAKQKMERLSGGERQRVAIARALAQGAELLMIDEPVSGLDPQTAGGVMKDLRALCEKTNVTVICSLSQTELAEKYATRIWGLSGGKLVVDIPARRLTQREKMLIF